jgi:hypothetical protein
LKILLIEKYSDIFQNVRQRTSDVSQAYTHSIISNTPAPPVLNTIYPKDYNQQSTYLHFFLDIRTAGIDEDFRSYKIGV